MIKRYCAVIASPYGMPYQTTSDLRSPDSPKTTHAREEVDLNHCKHKDRMHGACLTVNRERIDLAPAG